MTLNGNDALDYSKPAWLAKASRGAWVMATVQLLALLAYLLAAAGIVTGITHVARTAAVTKNAQTTQPAATPANPADDEGDDGDAALSFGPSLDGVMLVGAVGVAGLFFLAEAVGLIALTPNEERFPDRMKSVRLAARVTAGASAVFGVLLLAIAAGLIGRPTAISALLLWVLPTLIELAFAVCGSVSWFWVRAVVRRGGRSGLARLCGYLLFLPVLPFLKAAPFIGLYMLYALSPLLYLLPLAYIPLSIYLYARSAWLLRQAIPHAEEAWAKESNPQGLTVGAG